MSEGIIEEYRNSLDEEIQKVANRLISGSAKTYEEYVGMTREIKAYKRAKENFADEVRKYQIDNDESGD